MSDRNEWFKDVKRLIRGLEVETVEDPFACPTVKSVTDGEDVLHALGLHPSRDVCGIVNVDIDEVYGFIRHIEPEPVTGSTSDASQAERSGLVRRPRSQYAMRAWSVF